MKTPWAELLVDPAATDNEIRARYHALARLEHPDLRPDGYAGPRWGAITTAYKMVATNQARALWARRRSVMSGRCRQCHGSGVCVKTLGKDRGVRACAECAGEGRL